MSGHTVSRVTLNCDQCRREWPVNLSLTEGQAPEEAIRLLACPVCGAGYRHLRLVKPA